MLKSFLRVVATMILIVMAAAVIIPVAHLVIQGDTTSTSANLQQYKAQLHQERHNGQTHKH